MKTASRILMTFAILVFFTGMTFSQVASTATPAKASTKSTTTAPAKVVDTNKDGTYDKNDSKGTCAQGKNFVDKNGDGKCDNCGGTGKCNGTGCGKGQGKSNCCGQGQKQGSGCTKPCGNTPATQPKK